MRNEYLFCVHRLLSFQKLCPNELKNPKQLIFEGACLNYHSLKILEEKKEVILISNLNNLQEVKIPQVGFCQDYFLFCDSLLHLERRKYDCEEIILK